MAEALLERMRTVLSEHAPDKMYAATAKMAGLRITVESDDRDLFDDFYVAFGGPEPKEGRIDIRSDVHVEVRAGLQPGFGWFCISGANDLVVDGREFSFAIDRKQGPYEALAVDEPGWTAFGFRDTGKLAFAFRDRECLFTLGPYWRRSFIWFLFWRFLRTRSDAIFFHASALGIFGEGTIFAGPPGNGKSTTAVALAARGHNFLSDEVACYLPATGELLPYRRPVGFKPGPRAAAARDSPHRPTPRQVARDGVLRIEIETLFPVEPAQAWPLRRVVFLRGFAEKPLLERIEPGRAEIVELQPLMSSFLNAPHSQRVFELTRLLSTSKVYKLHLGEPDETAAYIEEALGRE